MITRKNRKQSLKVREMKEIEEQLDGDGSNNRDRQRYLIRIFLETWLETKQQLISNGGSFEIPNESIHEAISRKLVAKGYNISSKLALNKTGTFYKKYLFVRQCEQEGKKIEWANYDIVKKIFELSEPNPEPTVVIPLTNIKNEDELTIIEEDLPALVDEKVNAVDGVGSKIVTAPTQMIKEVMPKLNITTNVKSSVKSEDDDVEVVTNGSSDASDLDDDLDFENPLDSIQLRLPDTSSFNSAQNTASSLMPPPIKRIKRDSTDTKPLLHNDGNKFQKSPHVTQLLKREPITKPPSNPSQLTMPGLKPGEFLVPTGVTKPGQKQQFLVVKRLASDNAGTGSTSPVLGQNGKDIKPFAQTSSPNNFANPFKPPRKSTPTPPLQPSPVNSPFIVTNTPSPPLHHVPNNKPIQIPLPILHGQATDQDTKNLLSQLIDTIKTIEQERLDIEKKRYEAELEHQKQMLNLFKDIRDKLCDIKKD